MIWQISIFLIWNIGLGLTTPTNVFYFPDPKNPGEVIPAYLDGQPPDVDAVSDNSSIYFYLMTPHSKVPQKITPYDVESVRNANFIPNAPLKILSHGFGGSYKDYFPAQVAKAFAERGDAMNLILIDWSKLATSPWYQIAAPATKLVGITAGNLLKFLMDEDLVSIDQIHIIGFSLGGHVAGNIGHELGGQAARVTSLDPALPFFDITGDENRIDPSDGKFVEVIHTAGGFLHENGIAFITNRGHVDFFPNRGQHQPGCEGEVFGECSHGYAPYFYEESIRNPESFLACRCEHWFLFIAGKCDCSAPITFGMNSPADAKKGKYFFLTQDKSPFGMGRNGLVTLRGKSAPLSGGSDALVTVYGMFLVLAMTVIHKLLNL